MWAVSHLFGFAGRIPLAYLTDWQYGKCDNINDHTLSPEMRIALPPLLLWAAALFSGYWFVVFAGEPHASGATAAPAQQPSGQACESFTYICSVYVYGTGAPASDS